MNDSELFIKKVGERIKEIRKKKGLTQYIFAELLGIEDSALRRIENGRTNPTLKTLLKICDELDIHISELLKIES